MKIPTGKSSVGIKKLAESIGISIGTVSRALNNRQGVNARTRERVLEEARRMGYVPNSAARQLKDTPSLVLGLFFAPFVGPGHTINPAALSFVEMMAKQAETESISLRTLFFTSEEELKIQAEANHLDVAIFYGQFPPEAFDIIHRIGIPAIILHSRSPHPDQISLCIDMRHAAATAVEYLAALGHERIGIVTGPHIGLHAANYHQGFLEALEEFALPYCKEWDFELAAEKANKAGACEVLTSLMRKKDRPSAFLFTSDWMALGGRQAAAEAGLSVPREVSIIGFENMPTSAEIDPPLTTFDIHFPKAAELVIELAEKLGEGRRSGRPVPTREILISAELIKRKSCFLMRGARQQ